MACGFLPVVLSPVNRKVSSANSTNQSSKLYQPETPIFTKVTAPASHVELQVGVSGSTVSFPNTLLSRNIDEHKKSSTRKRSSAREDCTKIPLRKADFGVPVLLIEDGRAFSAS